MAPSARSPHVASWEGPRCATADARLPPSDASGACSSRAARVERFQPCQLEPVPEPERRHGSSRWRRVGYGCRGRRSRTLDSGEAQRAVLIHVAHVHQHKPPRLDLALRQDHSLAIAPPPPPSSTHPLPGRRNVAAASASVTPNPLPRVRHPTRTMPARPARGRSWMERQHTAAAVRPAHSSPAALAGYGSGRRSASWTRGAGRKTASWPNHQRLSRAARPTTPSAPVVRAALERQHAAAAIERQ